MKFVWAHLADAPVHSSDVDRYLPVEAPWAENVEHGVAPTLAGWALQQRKVVAHGEF